MPSLHGNVDPGPSRWHFPPADEWEPIDDVIAIGAELDPPTVLEAYCNGLFPMHLATGELAWWSPDPRGILPLDSLRVTRSLAKSCRRYTVTLDSDFRGVMRACGGSARPDAWITEEFVETYGALHDMGWAHSVEVWDANGNLAGGLYGIEVGGLFAGESMFHRERDASKVALVALVDLLRAAGGDRLLDVQWRTEHLASLGVVEIPRVDYLARLSDALDVPPALAHPGDSYTDQVRGGESP